jgi:hypothetical protein
VVPLSQDANGLSYAQLRDLTAQVNRRTRSHAVRNYVITLLHYADADLTTHPAQGQLARDLGCGLREVQRLQRKAMTCGLLSVTAHGGPVTGQKGQRPNLYQLNLTVPPCQPERGATPRARAVTPPDTTKTPPAETVKVTCKVCGKTGEPLAGSESALTGVCAPCRRKDKPPSKLAAPPPCQDCGGLGAYHALGPSEASRCEKCWHRFFTARRAGR